jgi:hypothetical protein
MLTIHPVLDQYYDFNKYAESMHGVIPALLLAGVDFGFNALAATPVGGAIGSAVDAGFEKVVQPLPHHLRRPAKKTLKKASAEAVKIGTTIALLKAAETQGCVIS